MSDRHTIALLNDSFPPIIDGVANAVANYAAVIEKNHGHSVVITPHMPGTDDSRLGYPVVRYPSIDTRKQIGYMTGYPFSPDAARAVEKENVELLHTHCPITSCLLARSLAEALDLPLVLTWHTKYDIDIARAVSSRLLQEGALQALLRNVNACDEIWTVSRGAGENLRSIGFEGDYIVMPNGVDLPRQKVGEVLLREVTSPYDLPAEVPCFLFIGRMMWYKGVRITLDALAELDKEDRDFRMVFVGGGGDEVEIREYAQALKLGHKVIFTGPVSDRDRLRAWYERADLFLFPSTFDTNGLVIREAAASDTASVIIAGSCASEGVTDGRNGFLIEENSAALAAKLREVMGRPDVMKRVGEGAGNELYISWDDAIANACDRYEVVIDHYRSGFYGKHDLLRGSFMQSQGELMQLIAELEDSGRELRKGAGEFRRGAEEFRRNAENLQQDADKKLRTARNKAIVDAITVGYEAGEELKSKGKEALNSIESFIDEVSDDIWQKLDRYL